MRTKICLLAFLLAFEASGAASQSVVMLSPKKVTYKRQHPIAAHKRTFTINYPRIKAATPALSRKIESLLSYEKIFGFTVAEELRDVQWLETADFSVEYNADGILAIDLTIEGSGAYPDGSTRSVVIDIRSGTRVTPAAAFADLARLASAVKKMQQKEIAEAKAEIRKDPDAKDLDPDELFASADVKIKDLDWFSVSETGVVFKYDYGFPHVIKALQPPGEYFFSWQDLRPYLKNGGLLSRAAR
ncbi:MAG: hypothetical protein KF736_12490 [Acidobacteria bacterium]|nr:hypothetical protein [Acidobacteriota bacterium]MCW5950473.1 hypothetical protein [Pyrinomonadaceae bacterium]